MKEGNVGAEYEKTNLILLSLLMIAEEEAVFLSSKRRNLLCVFAAQFLLTLVSSIFLRKGCKFIIQKMLNTTSFHPWKVTHLWILQRKLRHIQLSTNHTMRSPSSLSPLPRSLCSYFCKKSTSGLTQLHHSMVLTSARCMEEGKKTPNLNLSAFTVIQLPRHKQLASLSGLCFAYST